MPGHGYLARAPADRIPAFLRDLVPSPSRFCWITPRPPVRPPPEAEVQSLTPPAPSASRMEPRALDDAREASEAFLDRHPRAFLVLDGLEALIPHYGSERIVRWVGALHEVVAIRGGCLLAFVDPAGASPRFLALLARELDPLPPREAVADLPAA